MMASCAPPHAPDATLVSALTVSVVVPTYDRPEWLVRCLESLLRMTRVPDEIIAVMRDTDLATQQAFECFVAGHARADVRIRRAFVKEPGFLPPVEQGIAEATGDIVVFLDDDSEASSDWLERLLQPYSDPNVGGVGGRCVNADPQGRTIVYPPARYPARFYWFGRIVGNMYRDVVGDGPRDVDFFCGGNMSYRGAALKDVLLDRREVAFHYEVDLGLQLRERGWKLIYDPDTRVRHFSAPRKIAGLRTQSSDSVFWLSHNVLYIALKHSHGLRRLLTVTYSFAVGSTNEWGFASAAVDIIRRRRLKALRELMVAFRGKMLAIRETAGRPGGQR